MTGKRLRANGSPYEIFINGKFFPPYEMFINGKAFPSRRRGGRYCAANEGPRNEQGERNQRKEMAPQVGVATSKGRESDFLVSF